MKHGYMIIRVINDRQKGVVWAGNDDVVESCKELLKRGITEITIKHTSGTFDERERGKNFLMESGWRESYIDKDIMIQGSC